MKILSWNIQKREREKNINNSKKKKIDKPISSYNYF
jgi:hypothetical protein